MHLFKSVMRRQCVVFFVFLKECIFINHAFRSRLRTLLKTAKKKLKDQDRSGIGFVSSGPISNKVSVRSVRICSSK